MRADDVATGPAAHGQCVTTTLDRPGVTDSLHRVGANGSLNPLPGGRLVVGYLTGSRLPFRPALVRGGRILIGLAVARRVVFVGRLAAPTGAR